MFLTSVKVWLVYHSGEVSVLALVSATLKYHFIFTLESVAGMLYAVETALGKTRQHFCLTSVVFSVRIGVIVARCVRGWGQWPSNSCRAFSKIPCAL